MSERESSTPCQIVPLETIETAKGTSMIIGTIINEGHENCEAHIHEQLEELGAVPLNESDMFHQGNSSTFGFNNWNRSRWKPRGPDREWMRDEPDNGLNGDPRNN